MTSHHPVDALADLVAGRLGDRQRDVVLEHVAGCPECRELLAEQQSVRGALASAPTPAAPDGFAARLAATTRAPDPAPARRGRRAVLLGVATAVAVTSTGLVSTAAVLGGAAQGRGVVPPVSAYAEAHAGAVAGLPGVGPALRDPVGQDVPVAFTGRQQIAESADSIPVTVTVMGLRDGAAVVDAPGSAWSGVAGSTLAAGLGQGYRVLAAGPAVVADREAERLEVLRQDGSLAAVFVVDTATGLTLSRTLYDREGRPFSRLTVTSVRIGEPVSAPVHLPRRWTPLPAPDPELVAGWRGLGVAVPETLAGLPLVGAQRLAGGGAQLLYSDGLLAVSVFARPGHLAAAAGTPAVLAGRTVQVSPGSPRAVTWTGGVGQTGQGIVYTVIADADGSTLAEAVAELPGPAATGGLPQVERGLRRLADLVAG